MVNGENSNPQGFVLHPGKLQHWIFGIMIRNSFSMNVHLLFSGLASTFGGSVVADTDSYQ